MNTKDAVIRTGDVANAFRKSGLGIGRIDRDSIKRKRDILRIDSPNRSDWNKSQLSPIPRSGAINTRRRDAGCRTFELGHGRETSGCGRPKQIPVAMVENTACAAALVCGLFLFFRDCFVV